MGEIRVFISYCFEESINERVVRLSDKLNKDGIECEVEQYQPSFGGSWQKWMDEKIAEANYILFVCTEKSFNKIQDKKSHGFADPFEATIAYNEIVENQTYFNKTIPIVFKESDIRFIPNPLKSSNFYHVLDPSGYDFLLRRIINQPVFIRSDVNTKSRNKPSQLKENDNKKDSKDENLPIENDEKTNVSIKTGLVEMEITINKKFNSFSETEKEKLMEVIKKLSKQVTYKLQSGKREV